MKKILLAILGTMVIGACGFIPTPAIPTPTAIVESPTTVPTQTDTALPTETSAPPTETFTSTPDVPVLNPTITPVSAENLTGTPLPVTVIAATDTSVPVVFPSSVTPSPTNGVLTYGTLPPAVPSEEIILVNKAKVEVYISLQNQGKNGAILEYPVKGQFSIRAPLGQYIYVAWVGGRKMTGSFTLSKSDPIFILIYKEKIVVQK